MDPHDGSPSPNGHVPRAAFWISAIFLATPRMISPRQCSHSWTIAAWGKENVPMSYMNQGKGELEIDISKKKRSMNPPTCFLLKSCSLNVWIKLISSIHWTWKNSWTFKPPPHIHMLCEWVTPPRWMPSSPSRWSLQTQSSASFSTYRVHKGQCQATRLTAKKTIQHGACFFARQGLEAWHSLTHFQRACFSG